MASLSCESRIVQIKQVTWSHLAPTWDANPGSLAQVHSPSKRLWQQIDAKCLGYLPRSHAPKRAVLFFVVFLRVHLYALLFMVGESAVVLWSAMDFCPSFWFSLLLSQHPFSAPHIPDCSSGQVWFLTSSSSGPPALPFSVSWSLDTLSLHCLYRKQHSDCLVSTESYPVANHGEKSWVECLTTGQDSMPAPLGPVPACDNILAHSLERSSSQEDTD